MAHGQDLSIVDLLARLRDDHLIRLTPTDAVRVERLLAAHSDWTAPLLAHSLASLLAIDAEGWRAIAGRIEELLAPLSPVGTAADTGTAMSTGTASTADSTGTAASQASPAGARLRPATLQLPAQPAPLLELRQAARHHVPAILRGAVTGLLHAMMRMRLRHWAALAIAGLLVTLVMLALWPDTKPKSLVLTTTPITPPASSPAKLQGAQPATPPSTEPAPHNPGPATALAQPAQPQPQPAPEETQSTDANEPEPPAPARDRHHVDFTLVAGSRRLNRGDSDVDVGLTHAGWLVLITSVLAAIWSAAWLIAPRRARTAFTAEIARARRAREYLARTDTSAGVPYHVERHPPFAEAAMDDAAVVLGRIGLATAGVDLDVPATVRSTARSAGRVKPVLRPRFRPGVVLVLVDVESGDHAFLDGVDWVLARWRKRGVDFDRYDYAWRPHYLTPACGGPTLTLDQLARRRPDARVLILSPLSRPERFTGGASWLRTLMTWPTRVLIDLDPRPDAERSYDVRRALRLCAREGLPRYPFTPRGLVAAVRCLAGERVAPPPRPPLLPMQDFDVAVALARWAACAAYVPRPGWRQLESLRRTMPELTAALPSPAYVVHLMAWLSAQPEVREPITATGQVLILPEALEDRLMAEQRRVDAAAGLPVDEWLETRARGLLIEQLDAAAPTSQYEALRRALKRAVHRALLDPAHVGTLLARFRGSAAEPELRQLLARERVLQTGGTVLRAWPATACWSVDAWVARKPRVSVGDLAWPARSWRMGAIALSAACAVAVVWVAAAATLERSSTRYYLPYVVEAALRPPEVGRLRPALVPVPGGSFYMGSPETEKDRYPDEGPQHEVTVSSFEMCRTEVTQGQWDAVMASNSGPCGNAECGGNLPVQNLSWLDAVQYLNALTRRENQLHAAGEPLTLCYTIAGDEVTWKADCTGYRLPTEAEWEYAARAETMTAYSFGHNSANISAYAWYEDNTTQLGEVGWLTANDWGLYDMHGNAWEWVWDWYGPYKNTSQEDPRGPEHGKYRVIRGGSAFKERRVLRSAYRDLRDPKDSDWSTGIRCARGGARASAF